MNDILKRLPVCENCINLQVEGDDLKCVATGKDVGLLQQCKENYSNKYGLKLEEN